MDIVKVHADHVCPLCAKTFASIRRCNEHVGKHTIEEAIIAYLATGPKTRDEIVNHVGKPRSTVYDALHRIGDWISWINHNKPFTGSGRVTRKKVKVCPRQGRPQVLFALVSDKK